MRLEDFLKIPYVLGAESVEHEPGQWVRRVSYPELPGCVVEGDDLEEAINELERRKVLLLVEMVSSGERPPTPRPKVNIEPDYTLVKLGLTEEIKRFIDGERDDTSASG